MKTPLTKILYAEDEEDIRSIAQIALEDVGGFTLEFCENGQEVVSKIEHFKPDLLLLDVMMPMMDGPSALKAVRKIPGYENVPAIFMTAKIQPAEIAEYKALGVLDVITKPFDPMTLSQNLVNIWTAYDK